MCVVRLAVNCLAVGDQRAEHADLLGQIGQVIGNGDERRREHGGQIVFGHFVDGLVRCDSKMIL